MSSSKGVFLLAYAAVALIAGPNRVSVNSAAVPVPEPDPQRGPINTVIKPISKVVAGGPISQNAAGGPISTISARGPIDTNGNPISTANNPLSTMSDRGPISLGRPMTDPNGKGYSVSQITTEPPADSEHPEGGPDGGDYAA